MRFLQQRLGTRRNECRNAVLFSTVGASYIQFAKESPRMNNFCIAVLKTSAADIVAQCGVEGSSLKDIDVKRNIVFCVFGGAYLGVFQYWYQVNIFKKMFPSVERFTNQSLALKLKDRPGLNTLFAQVALDLSTLSLVYLPTFYILKESIFSGSWDLTTWFKNGFGNYSQNWKKDTTDLAKFWIPCDLICFSIPLYLRLPIRHVFSFVWTAYLSFVRGARKPKPESR